MAVFFPDPIGGPVPAELSTGNPDDDQLLRQIAARASLDQPRAWRHYFYAPDEGCRQAIARPLARTGWDAEIWAPETAGELYCVMAERQSSCPGEVGGLCYHGISPGRWS